MSNILDVDMTLILLNMWGEVIGARATAGPRDLRAARLTAPPRRANTEGASDKHRLMHRHYFSSTIFFRSDFPALSSL
jgi:hypothetical protein